MAALIAEVTYNVSPNLGGKMLKFEAPTTATGDWCIFPDPIGAIKANEVDGSDAVTAYAAGAVDVPASTWSATDVTLHYDGATATQVPASGYIMCGSEIIYFAAGGAAAEDDLTGCIRGCFGTTAAAHADGEAVYFINTVVFTLDTAGPIRGIADVIEE